MPKPPVAYCLKPVFQQRGVTLYRGDCLDILPHLSGITAVVTDPPYGLKFMGKDWDHGIPGARFWKAIMGACKPGAPLLAFGGTRTHHRLMCAIEDAGWEIRDCLMWLYGSGFPKSHGISKAIDKAAGAKREKISGGKGPGWQRGIGNTRPWMEEEDHQIDGSVAATDAAKLWDGYGTALKPAYEPVVMAMKPLDGTFAENALEHGVAGINVDGGRISHDELRKTTERTADKFGRTHAGGKGWRGTPEEQTLASPSPSGRWPANVLLSHHPDCVQVGVKRVKGDKREGGEGRRPSGFVDTGSGGGDDKPNAILYGDADGLETVEEWNCHPDCPVGMLDRQSGERPTGGRIWKGGEYKSGNWRTNEGRTDAPPIAAAYLRPPSTGTASRFFYCAKAGKKERTMGGKVDNKHPTVKPLKLMEYLLTLVRMPEKNLVLDPFCGSGSTLLACVKLGLPCIGIEKDWESARTAVKRLKCALG